MAETARVNNIIASNAKQRLSQSDPSPCDNNSIIIAGGCSGYNSNTDLITQVSTGTVTAALQLQQGVLTNRLIMTSLALHLVIVRRLIFFQERNLQIRVYL